MRKGLQQVLNAVSKLGKLCAKAVSSIKWKQIAEEAKVGERIGNVKNVKIESPIKSVGMKLFLMFFVSILFFVIVVGVMSYSVSKNVIEHKVSDASSQTIMQAGQKLDFLYQNFDDMTLQIMLDKDLQSLLEEVSEANSGSYEYLEKIRQLTEKINVYLYSSKSIESIHLYTMDGKLLVMSGSNGNASEGAADQAWFKASQNAGGKAIWLDSKVKGYSNNNSTFAISRVMSNALTNNASAVLLIELKMDVLNKEIAQIALGDDSQVSITNAANKYIAVNDAAKLEQDAAIQLTADQQALESDSFTTNNGQLVAYYKSKVTGWYLVGDMPVSSLVKDAKQIFNYTIFVAIGAAVAAILIGLFVVRMIGRPLVNLRNMMQQGAQGKLTVRANFTSKDEIGQLGNSFDLMMQQITALVQQTSLSAQQVLETSGELTNSSKITATAAREIAVATDEISNGAAGLATESEKGNELTQHIGMQMKQVIEANLEMGTAAADVQSSSEQGTKYMAELIGKTNLTEEMMRSMVEKVDKLKDSTSSIRKILDVLNNLTKQTNILSLNATIEAARAGAAGKGFMVVADEIRKLADQSRQSIDVVAQITETIQTEISETVKVLSNATPIFQEQILAVKEADTIFKQVTDHMSGFIVQLSTVSDSISTLEQSQVVLSDAMTNVSAVAEQSLATSEEVASLSSEQLGISDGLVKLSDKLEQLSNSLRDSLSKFEV